MVDLNVFQCCRFLRHIGKVMVLVVLGFVTLTAYAVISSYAPMVAHGGARAAGAFFALLFFCALVVALLWAYFAAVLVDPGRVPAGWHPFGSDEEAAAELERLEFASYRPQERLAGSGRPRFCRKCEAWKPERAHHDSITGRCVLRMDHYCVWVLNCVGLLNYKAFLLFLCYTFVACGLAAGLLAGTFVGIFRGLEAGTEDPARPAIVFVAFVIDAAFCLSLAGFLIMHARLVAANCTTIEMYEKRRTPDWPYNRGLRRNVQDVFGNSQLRWFVPTYSPEERAVLLGNALRRRLPRSDATPVGSGYGAMAP
ncbi:hypothetical protein WJX81_005841 [Elliptochloris bilobata]|uniref:S-acyltransferase n=1 Tax=Elliptochloris bilobata TaxID=381761 RepID=A0AAW1S8D9_9CHLO